MAELLHFPAISLPGTAKHSVFPSVPVHSCPFNNMLNPHVRAVFSPHDPQLSTHISPKVPSLGFSTILFGTFFHTDSH